jgi:hypothetical protein
MANNDIAKQLIRPPNLPDTVQGDGRYLMRLLKKYLEDQAIQLNLANGFTADEINATDPNAAYTPRHFMLTFDRLGGHFTWDPPADISKLAYYELRTDTNVGSSKNKLDGPIYDTQSDNLPTNYAGTVYLYSVNRDGSYSNPSRLSYTKTRPYAPQDIALTKNNEGTLITFLDIPSNCIGAYVYVDGVRFDTPDNVFLYTNADVDYKIRKVEVSYYDPFGEGERAVLYCVVPDVTGFLVERNGSNLDFYWNPVDIYGAVYEVRVAVSPDWNMGIVLFTTKTNNKNRYIYPNRGDYYLMVKAIDAHGNYSENAAYQSMNTVADIHRNVILEYNQNDVDYPGSKINMYYDYAADNIALEREAHFGEYIMDIQLPQRYRARNWLSFECIAFSTDELIWDDAEFAWDDAVGVLNGSVVDNSLTEIEQRIAFYVGDDTLDVFLARENEDIDPETGGDVLESQHADVFENAHYGKGVKITPLTRLSYTADHIPEEFSLLFSVKMTNGLPDTILMVLADTDHHFLQVGYDSVRGVYYMVGSDGLEITIPKTTGNVDWITIGISQGETHRSLFVNSLVKEMSKKATIEAEPISEYEEIYCYPKIIV